jgi:hypothetical protein
MVCICLTRFSLENSKLIFCQLQIKEKEDYRRRKKMNARDRGEKK